MDAALEKFEERYIPEPNTGCFIWTGPVLSARRGYGNFTCKEIGQERAHRYAYKRYKGPIPDGLMVCHKCDNVLCVNSDHLFLGTAKDNQTDMKRKGRSCQGVKHWKARLTEAEVRAIRALKGKATQQATADRFGITREQARDIQNGKSWPHIR